MCTYEGNAISGTLPAALAELANAHMLLFDSNVLSGTVPAALLQSPELWRINLVSAWSHKKECMLHALSQGSISAFEPAVCEQ